MKLTLLIDGFAGDKVNNINIGVGTDIIHPLDLDDEHLKFAPSVLIGSIKARYDHYDPTRDRTTVEIEIQRFKKKDGKSAKLDDLLKLIYEEKE